jgi:hypothetical protein
MNKWKAKATVFMEGDFIRQGQVITRPASWKLPMKDGKPETAKFVLVGGNPPKAEEAKKK